jgi:hypothetical protein
MIELETKIRSHIEKSTPRLGNHMPLLSVGAWLLEIRAGPGKPILTNIMLRALEKLHFSGDCMAIIALKSSSTAARTTKIAIAKNLTTGWEDGITVSQLIENGGIGILSD